MNQKQLGTILIAIGILMGIFVYVLKEREDEHIRHIVLESGDCMLEDGTCLHGDRNLVPIIGGWALSGILVAIGVYLGFIDKTQEHLARHQVKVTSELAKAKKLEKEKDEWNSFLKGFEDKEKEILQAIKKQEGIKQSTLRFKTGLSKTKLSQVLADLEGRGFIKRVEKGKTKEVYIRNRGL